jgi:hypothetical protein
MGQLLDRETGSPVEGALVLLLGEEGRERGGNLTNAAGRFLLRAPGPGRYSLRSERIGYQTVVSDPFELEVGQTLGIRLDTGTSAIELEGIRVHGEQQCVVRPAEGLQVARVWEEARKALTVQAWTEGEGMYRFRLVHFERELDPSSLAVRSETRQVWDALSRNPMRSLPIESLLEGGFVRRTEDGGHVYYGPDAPVMLSDPFLDTHCFRLRESGEFPDLLGLAFEPVRRRTYPDIEGTLWLDRETARLSFLEFRYDWAPWPEAEGLATGRVEFQEMPSGAWIVRRWWIRMPRMAQVLAGLREVRPSLRLTGFSETGGEVIQVSSLDRQVVSEAPRGRVTGLVWDSLRHRPLTDATVFLSGTAFAARTDTAGRFLLEEVPEGTYTIAFSHPLLDSLGVYPPGSELAVAGPAEAQALLAVPSRASVLAALCAGMERPEGHGVVTGTVHHAASGTPVAAATVRLEWKRYSLPGGVQIREERQGLEVATDQGGRFRACGVPPGPLVRAVATLTKQDGPPQSFEVGRDEVVVVRLTLDPSRFTP